MTYKDQQKLQRYFYKCMKKCPIPFTARVVLGSCAANPNHWWITIVPKIPKR